MWNNKFIKKDIDNYYTYNFIFENENHAISIYQKSDGAIVYERVNNPDLLINYKVFGIKLIIYNK